MDRDSAGDFAGRHDIHIRGAIAAMCLFFLAGLQSGCTPAPRSPQPVAKADRILVLKSARELELLYHGTVLKIYPIALGGNPIGPKRVRGDEKTPEGIYVIDRRNDHSAYTLALHISYPNADDRARSASAHADPGGDIFIHGLPPWYGPNDPDRFYKDWTDGCISVGNTAIREIWEKVDDGTPIEIRP
jgi:murein L,D-transpeptidase YafK